MGFSCLFVNWGNGWIRLYLGVFLVLVVGDFMYEVDVGCFVVGRRENCFLVGEEM